MSKITHIYTFLFFSWQLIDHLAFAVAIFLFVAFVHRDAHSYFVHVDVRNDLVYRDVCSNFVTDYAVGNFLIFFLAGRLGGLWYFGYV